jgi:hypothetical protein
MKITLFKGNKWINDKTIHITKSKDFHTIPTIFKTPTNNHERYVVVNWLFFSFIIQRWMRTDYRIKTLWGDFKLWFKEVILRRPIYYYWFTTKPNPKLPNAVLETWGFERAKSRKEFNKERKLLYESAEGETHIYRVSKHQYYKNFGKRGYTNV